VAGSGAWGSLVVASAVLLTSAAVSIGLHVPGIGFLAPFAEGSALDYSAGPAGAFAPLEARYVNGVLGGDFAATAIGHSAPPTGPAGEGPGILLGGPVNVRHPFTNDNFSQAYPVTGTPFTARTNTKGASREPGETTQCGRNATVWYRFRAPADTPLLADTFGSDYGLSLGVFRRSPSGLQLVGCDTDRLGNAQVSFSATAATTYYFRIARELGTTGTSLVFHLARLGVTSRASVSSAGRQANGLSSISFPSRDGRFVAFDSDARNIVPNQNVCVSAVSVPPTACDDVYVRDRVLGTTSIASVSSNGTYGNDTSFFPSVSGDGRLVAFVSWSSNLVPGDTNGLPDTFVHDFRTGQTIRVSVSTSGAQGYADKVPGIANDPLSLRELFPQSMISESGRFVAFESRARGLVPGDRDRCFLGTQPNVVHCRDIYVKDLVSGRTTLVTDPGHGDRADNDSLFASISATGRYVLFLSTASNLIPGRSIPGGQMYLRDLLAGTTTVVSTSSSGDLGNGASIVVAESNQISADGRYVVFGSLASNLVPGDKGDYDIFVHDLRTGRTILASISSSGEQKNGNDTSGRYSISEDGRYVVFDSRATNLVPGDSNGHSDAFVHDLLTGGTTRVSLSSDGRQGNGDSTEACGSPDGRVVVFSSRATNLVPGDTNRNQDVFVNDLPG